MDTSRLLTFLLIFCAIGKLDAQESASDTIKYDLEPIQIEAVKLSSNFQSSAMPVSLLKPKLSDNTGIGLKPLISGTPGLFAMNANNYAQDLRIAIRGFGARSAFGIRGIKIVVDGVPETTPDGQGQLDNLDLYVMDKVEVVRGAASSLYGNASGGVIYINSQQEIDTGFVELNAGLGSFGIQRYDAAYGFSGEKFQAILHGSHAKAEGYREQSGFENNVFHGGWTWNINESSQLSGTLNYTNAPVGDDPGGLKLEDVSEDRRQAREANVLYKAGEAVTQLKGNLSFDKNLGDRSNLKLYGFANQRTFDGRLPFEFGGVIDLDRFYYGQGGQFTYKNIGENLVANYLVGYDLAFQSDDRKRFRNLQGEQGDQTLDQTERFNNQALYAIGKWTFTRWFAEQSVRLDINQLKNQDHFLEDGDDSGEINLSNVNFSTGVGIFLTSDITLVGRYGTAFETPTLSELSANPTGAGGFNEELSPQSSATLEFGIKGNWRNNLFELTWFDIKVKDEILPYELEDFPGRTFYNNSGKTSRTGIELAHSKRWLPFLSTQISYTWSDFKFEEYNVDGTDFSQLQLPGIPANMLSWRVETDHSFINASLSGQHYGAMWADNANTEEVKAFSLLDFSAFHTFKKSKFEVTPYFHIENLLDVEYFDNIRINAFGGRYYEPGPGRQFRMGVKVKVLK
ncbi:MAG: TonB-dependent receptor [Bacteroidetes bacterium]|nr:MAG: TonB-dependent receptor [Bacteroidota bacterium]